MALRDTPQSKTLAKSADSASSTPQSREGNSVVYDMQDELQSGQDRLGGPAMTSTPVAEDTGRSKRHQRDKPSSGEDIQELELPISPLSSKSPTDDGIGRESNPLPDPGQTTSAELAAISGVDATDGNNAVCNGAEQVVGANRGAEQASDKDVEISSPIGVVTEELGDAKGTGDTEESQEVVTDRETVDVTIQDTAVKPEEEEGGLKGGGHEMEAASSLLATSEVSPSVEKLNSSPATLEVSSTVEKQLESASPGLDTDLLPTEPSTTAAKPLEFMEVGGASSPESAPALVGEGRTSSMKDIEASFLKEPTVAQREGLSLNTVLTPDVLTGQQEEEEVQTLKKVRSMLCTFSSFQVLQGTILCVMLLLCL